MEPNYLSRRVSLNTFHRNFYQSDYVMTPEEAQRTQKPYRYGMILLCFGALINWIGLAENYTDPFRYAGVACIIGGAFLICTAMCCWLHVPNRSAVGVSETDDNDAIHVITVADATQSEKPPEYDAVCSQIDPPCYDDAIKLSPANLLQTKYYQNIALPNYNELDINAANNYGGANNSCSTSTQRDQEHGPPNVFSARNAANSHSDSPASRSSAFIAITIEQTASHSANETSITQKSHDDNASSAPSS